jgi:hypothetical protein
MPERINAAHRLDQVLSEAAGLGQNLIALEAWANVFGIPEGNPQARAVEVARMIGLLREQTEEIHRKMGDTPVRARQYESAVRNILNALDISNLSNSWEQYRQYLPPETLI